MRRAAVAAAAFGLLGVPLLVAATSGEESYRVDAIFDNVAFLTEGQEVRIAGARAGEVTRLVVTPDHRARVEMRVDTRFAPFRTDADCTIQPQSLIGERFVQCTPGTPGAAALRGDEDRPATVPLENTHAPVDLDLILGTFDRPARERLGILLGSLGAGLAARDGSLNEAILRASPALQEARRVLRIVGRDRARLRQLVVDADTVLRALADRRAHVEDFVREAARVMSETGRRTRTVQETARRLPAFLDEARPALTRLEELARAGTPLMAGLRRGGPVVASLLEDAQGFANSARPTLRALSPVVEQTRRAIPDVAPQLRRLARFARPGRSAGLRVEELLTSLRDQGAFEGLGGFLYYVTAALSRFDRLSHILPNHMLASPCAAYARTPVEGCSARFSSSRRAEGREAAKRRDGARPEAARDTPAPQYDRLLDFLLR